MRAVRIGVHGAALCGSNLAAVVAAHTVYMLVQPADGFAVQLAVQIPVAVLLSAVFFVGWYLVTLTLSSRWGRIGDARSLLWLYLAAFVWNPVFFVPVHYLVRGYVTPFVNLRNGWVYQAGANLVVLGTISFIARARGARSSPDGLPPHGAEPAGRGL